MIEKIFVLFLCHFIGDYVLQTDFLATTKGSNWWHMIAHCFLYTVPFYICFGWCWQLLYILVIHFSIDIQQARYKTVGYVYDQIVHILCMMAYLT